MKANTRSWKQVACTGARSTSVSATAKKDSSLKPFRDIPGPKSLPLVGSMWKYLPFIGEYSFDRLHRNGLAKLRKFGPLVREEMVPGVNVVWVFEPQDIEMVFRSEGRYPERRSHLALQKYREDRKDVYNGGGLLPTNGPEWLKLRSVFQKGLSSPRNVKSYLPLTDVVPVLEEFLAQIPTRQILKPHDFLPDLSRLFLELICLVAFDVRVGALSPAELHIESRSSRLIDAVLETNSCILATDNGPRLWRFFETRLYKKLRTSLEYIEKVAVAMVNEKLKHLKARKDSGNDTEPLSLLELYLTSPDLDKKDVVGMAVDMILAGIDTTTYTSSFALYHLATNPGAQAALAAETQRLLPGAHDPVTSEVLAQATYCKAVLKETLRLNPISVGVGRILVQDTALSGYQVPAGTVVVTQNQVSCRELQHFSQPNTFIPERWVKGNVAYTHPNPYLVLPFGHGPRTCIARRLAEQNMQMLLLKMVRQFKVAWLGGTLDCKSLLINKPDQPVLLKFTAR